MNRKRAIRTVWFVAVLVLVSSCDRFGCHTSSGKLEDYVEIRPQRLTYCCEAEFPLTLETVHVRETESRGTLKSTFSIT